jgi:3-dehydroquinate synthase
MTNPNEPSAHPDTPLAGGQVIDRTFQVAWRHRIFFTRHLFSPGNPLLTRLLLEPVAGSARTRILVVLDAGLVAANLTLPGAVCDTLLAQRPALALAGAPLVLPGGETVKQDPAALETLHREIHRRHIDRHSWVIAVGGGALLDVAGFAAATAHRGCRHLRVPTTTLAQADSGVGIKNGVNAFGQKNFLGVFSPPAAVVNDFEFLRLLPERDRRAGCAEAVKVALIRDAGFFAWIEQQADALREGQFGPLETLIQRCAELHVQHIVTGGDPFETGSARPLDFGHWSAHKLEQLSGFRRRHGEAVAVGIALDTLYARHAGFLTPETAERILQLLRRLGFELAAPEFDERDVRGRRRLLEGLEEFREHLGGRLTLTLPRAIGVAFEVHDYHEDHLEVCLAELSDRSQATGPRA